MSFKKAGKGTCELNKHAISLIDENAELIDEQGVTFSMPLKVNRILSTNKINITPFGGDNSSESYQIK